MDLWTHDRWRFPLPQRHRFPIAKYPLRRIRVGELSVREQRGLGLPWSPELVERGRDPHAFTLSLHGARNYPFQRIPSDLDVDLATGTGDYLEALDHALDAALDRSEPEIAFYLAGADPWEGESARPPRPHQIRAARPRRARPRPAAGGRGRRLRRARRRLRGGRARHRRHQRSHGRRRRRAG